MQVNGPRILPTKYLQDDYLYFSLSAKRGLSTVMEFVDVEPTGDPFNSIIRLEANHQGKPFNPFINAGAITISSLLVGEHTEEKLESVIDFMELMIGRRPHIDEKFYRSEEKIAFRNRALAYFLKETGYLEGKLRPL